MIPLNARVPRSAGVVLTAGYGAGNLLRMGAGTSRRQLPRPRRVNAPEALALVPALRRDDLRGALVGWDGQLEDDARLVVAVARTAAAHGARILTRCAVDGGRATARTPATS